MSDTEEDDLDAMINDAVEHDEEMAAAHGAEDEAHGRNVRPRLDSPPEPPQERMAKLRSSGYTGLGRGAPTGPLGIPLRPPTPDPDSPPPPSVAPPASVYASPPRQDAPEDGAVDDALPSADDAPLAHEQQRAFDLALGGSNLFLTGGPGTGKSFTTRKIIAALEERNGAGSVLVWAPTGVAAILVGGQTMHSKPGPGIAESSESFKNMWAHKKYWRHVKTLVLDEISMVDAEFLDWIEAHVRMMVGLNRAEFGNGNAEKAFGGMQLIFCGDFCQLPPIPSSSTSLRQPAVLRNWQIANAPEHATVVPVGLKELKGKWCFQTATWRDAHFEAVQLQRSFRTGDEILLAALHELRVGRAAHPAVQQLVGATLRPLPPRADGIKPTTLYPTKNSVEELNRRELEMLDASTERAYTARDGIEPDTDTSPPPVPNPNISPHEQKKFGENCPAPETLKLRIGAQVMLIKNEVIELPPQLDTPEGRRAAHRRRLVNGSRGVVIAFRRKQPGDDPASSLHEHTGEEGAGEERKGADGDDDGADDDEGRCTPDDVEECAMGIMFGGPNHGQRFLTGARAGAGAGAGAGSSAGGGEGGALPLPPDWAEKVDGASGQTYYYRISDPNAVQWHHHPAVAPPQDDATEYPLVRFTNGRTKLVTAEAFSQKFFQRGKCTRSQLPLALAWALTIHKGQGQSLDWVVVDLQRCFENGQVGPRSRHSPACFQPPSAPLSDLLNSPPRLTS